MIVAFAASGVNVAPSPPGTAEATDVDRPPPIKAAGEVNGTGGPHDAADAGLGCRGGASSVFGPFSRWWGSVGGLSWGHFWQIPASAPRGRFPKVRRGGLSLHNHKLCGPAFRAPGASPGDNQR